VAPHSRGVQFRGPMDDPQQHAQFLYGPRYRRRDQEDRGWRSATPTTRLPPSSRSSCQMGRPTTPLIAAAAAGTARHASDQIGGQVDRLLRVQRRVQPNRSFAMFVLLQAEPARQRGHRSAEGSRDPCSTTASRTRCSRGAEVPRQHPVARPVNDLVTTTHDLHVNSDLATNIYQIPVPAGATQTNFGPGQSARRPAVGHADAGAVHHLARAQRYLGSVVCRAAWSSTRR